MNKYITMLQEMWAPTPFQRFPVSKLGNCDVPKNDMHANPKNDMHANPKSDMHATIK